MEITFRDINFADDRDAALLSRWNNDLEIRHLITSFSDEQGYLQMSSPEDFKTKASRPPIDRPHRHLMILRDSSPVGFAEFEINPAHRIKLDSPTAWLAIVIGQKDARRKGIGTIALLHLEQIAHGAGAEWSEVGVFEFNQAAQQFFTKLQYTEVARLPQSTFYRGRSWADIRMIKEL